MNEVKVYEIKKNVKDRFGYTWYIATFYTDMKTFTKCKLVIGAGVPFSFTGESTKTYVTLVKCSPEDKFDTYFGQSEAFERCIAKFIKAVERYNFGRELKPGDTMWKPKSKWGSWMRHITTVGKRFDETLVKVCGEK